MVDQLFVVVVSVEGSAGPVTVSAEVAGEADGGEPSRVLHHSARPDIAQPVSWQPPTEVVDR
jgi:hypothetical protein